MKDEEKSRPIVSIDTEDKLEAFFNKDEIRLIERLIEDVVDDALGFRDDYENSIRIKVYSNNIIDDEVRIMIGRYISGIGTDHELIYEACCYSIPVTEKLFKSIDRDFIFLIKPKLLTIDAIERKEV